MNAQQAAEHISVLAAERTDLPNTALRIAAWIAGVAIKTKGFPVDVTLRDIQIGFDRDGVLVAGTGCHHSTIGTTLDLLEAEGIIKVDHGDKPGPGGHHRKLITMG